MPASKSATWDDFRRAADASPFEWEVRFGVAMLYLDEPEVHITVGVHVPLNALEPASERATKATRGEVVTFEFETLDERGVNSDFGMEIFLGLWTDMWLDPEPEFGPVPGVLPSRPRPRGFVPPHSRQFGDAHLVAFDKTDLKGHDLAPLFGIDSTYLDEREGILDAGEDQDLDSSVSDGVTYRQTFLRSVSCPFCIKDSLPQAHLHRAQEPMAAYYGSKDYLVVCPTCDRVVEVIGADRFR